MKKLSFEEKQIVSQALMKAIKVVVDRTMANQERYLNLMSRIEFDKYRHQELVQLSKDINATQDVDSLISLLNKHTDILIELAEVSREAQQAFKTMKVRPKRR
jgi:hypothetical protein